VPACSSSPIRAVAQRLAAHVQHLLVGAAAFLRSAFFVKPSLFIELRTLLDLRPGPARACPEAPRSVRVSGLEPDRVAPIGEHGRVARARAVCSVDAKLGIASRSEAIEGVRRSADSARQAWGSPVHPNGMMR
jgi:hypothetical protein